MKIYTPVSISHKKLPVVAVVIFQIVAVVVVVVVAVVVIRQPLDPVGNYLLHRPQLKGK